MIKKSVFIIAMCAASPSFACDEHSAFHYFKEDPVAAAIDRQTDELERQQRLREIENIQRDRYAGSVDSLNNTLQLQNTLMMPPR